MNNPFKATLFTLIAFFSLASVFTSCKKDDDNSSNPVPPSGTTIRTTVTGRITDTDGIVMSGVTVKLGSVTTITDNRGYFLFIDNEVPKDRFVVVASKPGYFNCVRAKRSQSGDANYINMMMEALPPVVNIPGTAGGVVNITGGATITFQTSSFVDQNGNAYTGQVKVYARHISPGEDNFEAIVPGGDLLGLNTLGEEQSLYSLGMIEAKLYDNTGVNEVKLAPGKTAELKFPIDPSQSAVALSTIPMWHLDEATGLWQEEGQGTKTGSYYITNVSHFSTWNCDYSGPRCDIEGKVVDCQNNAMANVVVTINGFMNVLTDNAGFYTTWVPVGYLIECQVLQSNNPFLTASSPVQSVTAIAGQVNIIPTLIVPCATRISGNLKTCGGSSNSPGFIYATWNGGSNFQYTNNGNFQVYVKENTWVSIIASTSGYNGTTTFLSGAPGTNITVPDIELCNAVAVGQNKFTVNNNGGGSTTYLVNVTNSSTFYNDSNSDGMFESVNITINGIANPGNFDFYLLIMADATTMVDNYFELNSGLNNAVVIQMDSVWVYESGNALNTTTNKLIFTDYGAPGSVTSGTFEFDCPTGSITDGEFSVVRNN